MCLGSSVCSSYPMKDTPRYPEHLGRVGWIPMTWVNWSQAELLQSAPVAMPQWRAVIFTVSCILGVCVYVCVYIYIFTHIYIYLYIYIYTYNVETRETTHTKKKNTVPTITTHGLDFNRAEVVGSLLLSSSCVRQAAGHSAVSRYY